MRVFTTFVRNVQSHEDKINTGIAKGETPLRAASHLAVAIQGYDDEHMTDEEIVERFVDEGWRFELLEVKTDEDNNPIRIENDEVA